MEHSMVAGRRVVKEFYHRSGVRALTGIALDWAIVVGLAVVAQYFLHPVVYLAAILLIAGRMLSFETKWTHEAMHFNLFRRKPWNDRLEFLFAWPVLTSAALGRETHLAHHRQYMNEKDDPVFGYEYAGITPEKKNRQA